MIKRGLLCLVGIVGIFSFSIAWAEIKVLEKEVEEAVSRGQSQEQVEAFALQKAKRLAVEEAGTYISSLTIVQNYKLQKDEVTALASGVVQAKVVGIPAVRVENGVVYVRVKARIEVDTSVLDRQIQEIMRERGTLQKLEEERKKNKELEEKLANLKSSEARRLEELNTQALALERERDRQRLFREEQSLKARGELSKAEAERLAKEREMQERINKTLAEQERAKREEVAALAAEQDRIRRASLENEQRWNELSRKAKLSQESWKAIDDSLSLKQALMEAAALKKEIANMKSRLDYQYRENTKNLATAYGQQRALKMATPPPQPAPKDAFESTAEYNKRIEDHQRQIRYTEKRNAGSVETLKKEEDLKLAEAKVDYLEQQIRVLMPFVKRLQDLQDRKFTLAEGGAMTIELGEPDADNSRFPLRLQHNGKSWSTWWDYTDRNIAKDFYRTRTYLKAEGIFQIEEVTELSQKLTTARVTHLGTKETREFRLETPKLLVEIGLFGELKKEMTIAKETSKKAAFLLTRREIGNDGRFTAYDDGTVLDTKTNLMWAAKDNGKNINWQDAKTYCESYEVSIYTDWRMPSQNELAGLYDSTKTYKSNCGGEVHLTEMIRLTCTVPWASETSGSVAAFFYFTDGSRYWGRRSSDEGYRALPVRPGK